MWNLGRVGLLRRLSAQKGPRPRALSQAILINPLVSFLLFLLVFEIFLIIFVSMNEKFNGL